MDRDNNRARGDRSLSEPGGSSFGHGQLSDASRVCAAKAVGIGVKFRHRIGGTEATDARPFGKYSGSEVKLDDKEYLIMREDDVLAILE